MRRAVLIGYLTVVTVTIGGGFAFSVAEHVSFLLGAYWALATATTVGYGDVAPHDMVGRVIAMATMLVAIPAVAWAFAQLTSRHTVRQMGHTHDTQRIVADIHRAVTGENHPDAPRNGREN